jgi:hypothetical protein
LFETIIVWKLDRFARNRYDSAHYKALLRKNGVKVLSATEVIADDSTGILLESVLEGLAEYYSVELAEKINRGMTENALKGKFNGGGRTVGFTIDDEKHFQIDPLTAPLILEGFKLYDSGKTIQQITDILKNKGLKTSHGSEANFNFIANMLNNRRYIGEYRYRETLNTEMIPPIIPKDLFDRVQEKLAKNKKASARFKAKEDLYLLTTKLFCGSCGAFMIGESGTSHTGALHRYYKCATSKKKKCNKKPVKKDWIENLVVDYLKRIVFDDDLIDEIADKIIALDQSENIALPLLEKQLKGVNKAISNLLDAVQKGLFNVSTKERLDDLETQKAGIELKISQEEIVHGRITKEQALFWLHRFRILDTNQYEYRQRLVDTFLNAVYVYDDRVIIGFNGREGTDTLTLQEIEGSDMDLVAPQNSE